VEAAFAKPSTKWRDRFAARDDLATPHPIDAADLPEPEPDARTGSAMVTPPDAAPAVVGTPTFVRVYPERGAEYALGSESWRPVPEDGKLELALAQIAELQVRNTGCCQAESKTLRPGDNVTITTAFLPAVIVPRCAANPEVSVTIDDKPAHLGQHFTIPIGASLDGTQTVKVRFLGEGVDPQPKPEKVKYKDRKEVTCEPR